MKLSNNPLALKTHSILEFVGFVTQEATVGVVNFRRIYSFHSYQPEEKTSD
jgi:hypothetical protein